MKNENCDCNSGVRCNVNECVYNENGCSCNKETIDISLGNGEKMPNGEQKHYCKSFIDKNSCHCNPCNQARNVEASEEYFDSDYNKPYDEE